MKLGGNNDVLKFDVNGNFDGLDLVVDCIHETNNEALDGTDIDLTEIDIAIKDKETNEYVYNGGFKELALSTNPLGWASNEILAELGTVYDTMGASNPDKRTIAIPLDLPVMSGNFEIVIRIGTLFGGDTDASSKLAVGVNYTSEVAEFDTTYDVYSIPAGQTQFSQNLGSGVNRVVLVDFATPSQQCDTYAWDSVTFQSDEYTRYTRIQDLQAINKMGSINAEVENGGNLTVFEGEVVNNASLRMTLQTANISAGTQFVVVEKFTYDGKKVEKHVKRAMAKKLRSKIGIVKPSLSK